MSADLPRVISVPCGELEQKKSPAFAGLFLCGMGNRVDFTDRFLQCEFAAEIAYSPWQDRGPESHGTALE